MRARAALTLLACALLLAPGRSSAFHEGGVAACAGCHVMHGLQGGAPVLGPTGEPLLLDDNASDTCLRCHAAFGQFASGQGFGPGGDFYWVTKSWSWIAGSRSETSPGDSHGHNLEAPAYGLSRDLSRGTAPGGTFRSAELGCTSCHDPHGNGNFRMLYGAGAGPAVMGGRFTFANPAPLARGIGAITIPGQTTPGDETDSRHSVYKSGMSEWCANCHGLYHEAGGSGFAHPVGENLGSAQAGQYNLYLGQQNPGGGNVEASWWSLVPFEAVGVDLASANPFGWTTGPGAADRVMCLSCHRAHASPFRVAGRWDFDAALLVDAHPAPGDGGASAADVSRRDYGYAYSTGQGTLCRKCHREVPAPGGSLPTAP